MNFIATSLSGPHDAPRRNTSVVFGSSAKAWRSLHIGAKGESIARACVRLASSSASQFSLRCSTESGWLRLTGSSTQDGSGYGEQHVRLTSEQRRQTRRTFAPGLLAILLLISTASRGQAPCGIERVPEDGNYYPAIARAAHVSGKVVLLVSFDHEGKPSAGRILYGPEMLKKAASNFIEASKAESSKGSRECPIVVSFELADTHTCEVAPNPAIPFALIDLQHIAIYGRVVPICDPAAEIAKHRRRFLLF